MENKIIEIKKISELIAKSDIEYKKLMIKDTHFIPCEISIDDESLKFEYDIDDLQECIKVKADFKENIYIFLLDVSKLVDKISEYKFSINPSNLYYDYQYNTKIKERDIRREINRLDSEDFINQYKSLIGAMIQSKYKYEDYYEGGLDLLTKDKFLNQIYESNTIDEIVSVLKGRLNEIKKEDIENKVLVSKRKIKSNNRIKLTTSILSIVLLITVGYISLIEIPLKNKLLNASNAFIQSDYENVINSLNGIKIDKLPKESRYILANSYVNSENLSASQKKNILATISLQSQDDILNFWIEQGNLQLDKAIDTAKKLGDNELIMYSLIKKEQQILNDDKLNGANKEDALNKVRDEIEKLKSTLNTNKPNNEVIGGNNE